MPSRRPRDRILGVKKRSLAFATLAAILMVAVRATARDSTVLARGTTDLSAGRWLARQVLIVICLLTRLGIAAAAPDANSVPHSVAPPPHVSPIPLVLETNSGQASPETKFIALSGGALILIRGDRLSLLFPHPRRIRNPLNPFGRPGAPPQVEIGLLGSRPDATMDGDGALSSKVNYFIGSDPNRRIANIPTFRGVIVHDAWPGIDVSYAPANERNGSGVEMWFIVHPGAEPSRIWLSLGGSGSRSVLKNGDVEVPFGTRRESSSS